MSKITGKVNYKEVLKGDTGYTFEPHVTVDGVLYWSNNGDLSNPLPVNIRGKDGNIVQEEEINKINEKVNKNFNYLNSKFIEINVKDFGAKGDGVTDDTIAIQKAYDFIKDTGGTVFFPRGVYIVSMSREDKVINGFGEYKSILRSSILVKGNNITTRGEGCNLSIINMYPSDYRTYGTITGLLSSVFTLECSLDILKINQENIKFEDIQLNGGRGEWNQAVLDKDYVESNGNSGEIGTHGKGIHARTVLGNLRNLKIKNCIIKNMYAEGVHSHKAVDSFVENTLFSYNRPAGGNLSGSVTYKNCIFKKHYTFNLEHAHTEENKGTNYLKIIGCKFYDLDTKSQSHIVSNYDAKSYKNNGICIIKDCEFFLENDELDINYSFLTLTGYNYVEISNNIGKTKCSEGLGILPITLRNCKNVIIDNNYFDVINAPIYSFTGNVNGCDYKIINNKYSENVNREFINNTLKNTFGDNCIITHNNNEFIGKSYSEPINIKSNIPTSMFLNKIVSLLGQHQLILSSSENVTIKELYYIEPIRYGGDGVKHNILNNIEIEGGTIYNFNFKPILKLNKNIVPNSGLEFIIICENDCIINYRII